VLSIAETTGLDTACAVRGSGVDATESPERMRQTRSSSPARAAQYISDSSESGEAESRCSSVHAGIQKVASSS
jgi:hypothetical protein